MAPAAGPSTGSSIERPTKTTATRVVSRSKTNKRIDQERILDHLLGAFLDETASSASARAAQKSRAIQIIDRDSWSPPDDDEVAAALQGLSLKHSIHLDYELATAIQRCHSQLHMSCERSVRLSDQVRETEKRRGHNVSNMPAPLLRPGNVSHAIRLLLQLSKPADVTARTAANLMLNATHSSRAQYLTPEQRKQAERREWLNILVDEPLQGDVWDDDGEDQNGSDLSDWSLDSDDEQKRRVEQGYDSDKELRKRRDRLTATSTSMQPSASSKHDFRQRDQWSGNRRTRLEALERAKKDTLRESTVNSAGDTRKLTEADVVRESLAALMGFQSVLFTRQSSGQVTMTPDERFPLIRILMKQIASIAAIATTLASLQRFVATTVLQSIHAVDALTRTPAVEAFAEQIQVLLERLRTSLSDMDSDIGNACMSAHPAAVRSDRYTTMTQLLELVQREAATVLLLAPLLKEIGFISGFDAHFATPILPRAFSDRALIDGLQALLAFAHQQDEVLHRDIVLADLSTCLLAACRPAWRSVCLLLQRGLSFAIRRDHDALFDDRLVQHMIRHDASMSTSDSAFWTSGYLVNGTNADAMGDVDRDHGYSPPAFLQSIVHDVLTTAKGVGLLRSLGIDALGEVQPKSDLDHVLGMQVATSSSTSDLLPSQAEPEENGLQSALGTQDVATLTKASRTTPDEAKANLRQLLFTHKARSFVGDEADQQSDDGLPQTPLSRPDTEPLWNAHSADNPLRLSQKLLEPMLGRSLREHLSPISAIVRKRLTEVLSSAVTEGGYALQSHLEACHGLFFMQRGAEMTSWLDSLFFDLDRRNGSIRAMNHHRLNSGFADALEAHQSIDAAAAWIDINLVRFHTGDDDSETAAAIRQRTRMRRLTDVQVEYEVPWPLTFAFSQGCMRVYQSIFTTLLQARYAQWKLSSTLKLAKPETMHMRKFWSLRRQAQWLVRTLIGYIQGDVVLEGARLLSSAMEGTDSIDSSIQIHTEALARIEMLCFHRVEQAKVKELFSAAWRIGTEVVNNYERFIGTSNSEEDRLARRKRRERRKKRRDKAKQGGAPLGAIAEEEEEEEEEEEDDEEQNQAGEDSERDYDDVGRLYATFGNGDTTTVGQTEGLDTTSIDASMSADISTSWIESDTNKRERFRIECERQRKALDRLVEELKMSVDDQIGRIAARTASQAQDATQADRVLQEHDYARVRWQGLLDALAWSDMRY